MRLGSLGEAAAFQLSERETLAKVELVPHFLGTSWGGLPTAFRVQVKQGDLGLGCIHGQVRPSKDMGWLRPESQTGRGQVSIAPSPLSLEGREAYWVGKEGWCWGEALI